MFQPPNKTVDPESLVLANELLNASNSTLSNLKTFRKEQFQRFWYRGKNELRSREEINEILTKMDEAQIGQSARFFASAKALVDLILAIAPGSIEPEEWVPPYEYTIDPQTYAVRMTIPEPSEEPTPEEETP